MKVIIKETNYKTIEVPNDTRLDKIEAMIQNGDVIVGDTTETEYDVKYENDKVWYGILLD